MQTIRYTAHVMRGIVIDHIRSRASLKRGGAFDIVAYETLSDLRDMGSEEALKVNDAIQGLRDIDAGLAELVELKFFGGLSFIEIAALRKTSDRTVQRDWKKARLLLYAAVNRSAGESYAANRRQALGRDPPGAGPLAVARAAAEGRLAARTGCQ